MAKPSFYNHWKFKLLTAELQRSRVQTLGHIQMLWDSAASRNRHIFRAEEIEATIEWDGDEGKAVEALEKARLIDNLGDGQYAIHDWFEHCPEYIKRKNKINTDIKEEKKTKQEKDLINEDLDPYGLEMDEYRKILKGLKGSFDGGNYSIYIDRLIDEYEQVVGSTILLGDLIKDIKDARYYNEEKGVGKINNEKAFAIKKIKDMLN
jgi:hypothetical protein